MNPFLSFKYFMQNASLKFILVAVLSLTTLSFSQVDESSQNDLKNLFTVGKELLYSPKDFDGKDWLTFSSVAAATVSAYFLDETIREAALRNKSDFNDRVFSIDKYYVEGIALISAGIYGYGLLASDKDTRTLGLQLAEALIYSAAMNFFVKTLTGRSRPYRSEGKNHFEPVSFNFDQTSFPSGHTTLAFAFSTVMANKVNGFLLKAALYSTAAWVSAARIYNEKHWFSDVVFGAAAGYFIGEFISDHKLNSISIDRGEKTYSISLSFAL